MCDLTDFSSQNIGFKMFGLPQMGIKHEQWCWLLDKRQYIDASDDALICGNSSINSWDLTSKNGDGHYPLVN